MSLSSSNKEDGLSLGCCLLDNDGNGGIGMDNGLSLSCFSLDDNGYKDNGLSLGCFLLATDGNGCGSANNELSLSCCLLLNDSNSNGCDRYDGWSLGCFSLDFSLDDSGDGNGGGGMDDELSVVPWLLLLLARLQRQQRRWQRE